MEYFWMEHKQHGMSIECSLATTLGNGFLDNTKFYRMKKYL